MTRHSRFKDGESLQIGEERFRLLVDGIRDYAILLIDPAGHVSSWNLGAERIKGYTAAEILGRHFSVFYPDEAIERRWPDHELAVAAAEGRFEDEGWRVRKDGSRFWAHTVISALRDDHANLLGYSKITRDLTLQRSQDQALRRSEERFRLLVDGVRDYAIFLLDPTGRVASWNAGAERLNGYTAAEILGEHFSRFYPDDALARGWPQHELSVAGRIGRFEDEGWRIRKDGSRFWANVVISALHDESGRLVGFAKITRDLTERRKLELLKEQGQRTTEFLAMLGHELRNPLAPIQNAITILRHQDRAPQTVDWAHGVIDRQVRHLARIVDDLLDLGRITTGKIEVRREPLDLVALVTEVAGTVRMAFEAKPLALDLEVPPAPVMVLGDRIRLTQVVLNLLTNARKYTPAGGHVRVTVEPDQRFVQVRVADDGIGIPPDLVPSMFEPFVQGAPTLDRADGGLGIGLALVRKLIELHGGTVSGSSSGAGKGSVFVVQLPIARGGIAVVPARAPEPLAHQPRRVLVVDDNADLADTLACLLETWGHEVQTAADGATAMKRIEDDPPDVVLLDIGLPGMDGYAVAERLRHTGIALVAMTGYGQPEDVARSRAAGFAAHLVKPVDPDHLRRVLAELPVPHA